MRTFAALLALAATSAGASSIPLRWDGVQGATRYEICWSPDSFVSIPQTGPVTPAVCSQPAGQVAGPGVMQAVLDGLPPNQTAFVAVRACNANGCGPSSNILSGWPTPEVSTFTVGVPVRVSGATLPTWRQGVVILGANFKSPGQSVLVDYQGIRLISYSRTSPGQIDLMLEYDTATPVGQAELWIVNQDGAGCQYTPAARYAGCVVKLAGTINVQPILVPDRVAGLDWWLDGPRP